MKKSPIWLPRGLGWLTSRATGYVTSAILLTLFAVLILRSDLAPVRIIGWIGIAMVVATVILDLAAVKRRLRRAQRGALGGPRRG